jgi:hypothetical protein
MSETVNICSRVDKALWEHDRKYHMAGEETPFRTVVFRPDAYASFKHEMSRQQFIAIEILGRVDKYRGATIGCVWNQTEAVRIVER